MLDLHPRATHHNAPPARDLPSLPQEGPTAAPTLVAPMDTMTPELRQRLIASVERALRWRREQIMVARLTFFWSCWFVSGRKPDWHSLFECDRHGHHPLRGGKWVGPYELEDTIDTSGRFGAR